MSNDFEKSNNFTSTKYRKVYFEIEKTLNCGAYNVVLLLGLRHTGKTEILKQFSVNRQGFYHDFKENKLTYEDAEALFDRDEKLLLLDEIGYLDNFDLFMSSIQDRAASKNKQVVITSSAYGAMKQLGHEYLGAGRSRMIELFPLSFEEYLHFSRDTFQYGDDYTPTIADVQNFYRLEGIPKAMKLLIDEHYLPHTFHDIEVARANKFQDERDVTLTQEQYTSILDILAYTLNDKLSMKRLKGSQIGKQEFVSTKGMALSQSLIGLANKIVNKMTVELEHDIGVEDIAHIVAYLYHSGFLYVDLEVNEDEKQKTSEAFTELFKIKTFNQFKTHFNKYNFSVISPLLYTRLLKNFEFITEKFYDNEGLSGELYELSLKCEAVQRKGYEGYHTSRKYRLGPIEVDLWEKHLLLEATIGDKHGNDFYVNKIMEAHPLIRVLTNNPEKCDWDDTRGYYRIGYPKALLMISNGRMYNLKIL